MIAPEAGLSVSRQCTLLGIARSSFYYRPRPESAEELDLLKRLDRIFTDHPVYGSRRLQVPGTRSTCKFRSFRQAISVQTGRRFRWKPTGRFGPKRHPVADGFWSRLWRTAAA